MTARVPRVLFVCVGNSCRSQMAEGFARALGEGVWEVESAGLMPATIVAPLTREVMSEKNIDLGEQFPKPLDWVRPETFDWIINLSGYEMPPAGAAEVREWSVRDPIGQSEKVYRQVRDEIGRRVAELLEELRGAGGGAAKSGVEI